MSAYVLVQDGVRKPIDASCLADARERAGEWANEGSYADVAKTFWVSVRVLTVDDDGVEEHTDTVRVAIEPPEPKCSSPLGHPWSSPYGIVGGLTENPGVFGHGAGIRSHRVCLVCGASRILDTWATDPETGAQGLDSIEYTDMYEEAVEEVRQDARSAGILWAEREAKVRALAGPWAREQSDASAVVEGDDDDNTLAEVASVAAEERWDELVQAEEASS